VTAPAAVYFSRLYEVLRAPGRKCKAFEGSWLETIPRKSFFVSLFIDYFERTSWQDS
jgi:hypothetical protein